MEYLRYLDDCNSTSDDQPDQDDYYGHDNYLGTGIGAYELLSIFLFGGGAIFLATYCAYKHFCSAAEIHT